MSAINLIQLNDIRVPYQLQDMNLPSHALDVGEILDLTLLEDLDRDLLARKRMHP